jgi:hypothetical protein
MMNRQPRGRPSICVTTEAETGQSQVVLARQHPFVQPFELLGALLDGQIGESPHSGGLS